MANLWVLAKVATQVSESWKHFNLCIHSANSWLNFVTRFVDLVWPLWFSNMILVLEPVPSAT